MRQVVIRNLTTPIEKPITARYCDTFLCRLRGLTFRRVLPESQALLLVESRDTRIEAAIHMLGVWMDLAVVWINNSQKVVDVIQARAWHLLYVPRQPARYILELNPAHRYHFIIGDEVEFVENNSEPYD